MNSIISDANTKFYSPNLVNASAPDAGYLLLENLSSLQQKFLLEGGDTDLLTTELNKLYDTPASFSVDPIVFVDECALILCPLLDPYTAKHYRNLLYQLYHCFVNDDTYEQLCQRFELTPNHLAHSADANLMLDWMTLWLVHRFPSTALFLQGKKYIRPFIHTRTFHLQQFICYLPAFMLWRIRSYLHQAETRKLVLDLASGQQVRHAPSCPFPFNRKMAHLFVNSPTTMTLDTAIWRAIVLGWGGSEWLAAQLEVFFGCKTKDPKLLKLLVLFFQKADQQPSPNEMKHLLGYLQHRWDEAKDFTLKGWTLASLQRKARHWYENIAVQQVYQASIIHLAPIWKGAGYKSFTLKKEDSLFEIIQLNSIKKLQEEGRRMMHCVGNYAARCQMEDRSIWSLRQTKGERCRSLVTIEINKDHRIVQARKMFNANPEASERELIRQWAKREGLS